DSTQNSLNDLIATDKPKITAWNKCDLVTTPLPSHNRNIPISCKTGHGIEQLVAQLVETAGHRSVSNSHSLAAINARHQACLKQPQAALEQALHDMQANREPELIAVNLHAAIHAVGEIAGRIDTEEILGKIFSTFCIGK